MNEAPKTPRSGGKQTSTPGNSLSQLDQHLAHLGLLTRLMYRSTRVRAPWFKRWQINRFIRRYGVDMSQAEQPDLETYPDFNSFFIRALRPDARPIPADAAAQESPVDRAE